MSNFSYLFLSSFLFSHAHARIRTGNRICSTSFMFFSYLSVGLDLIWFPPSFISQMRRNLVFFQPLPLYLLILLHVWFGRKSSPSSLFSVFFLVVRYLSIKKQTNDWPQWVTQTSSHRFDIVLIKRRRKVTRVAVDRWRRRRPVHSTEFSTYQRHLNL